MFGFFKRQQEQTTEVRTAPRLPNPHRNQKRNFFSSEVDRVLQGWTTQASHIDYLLGLHLESLRARSHEAVQGNPYAKRFVITLKSNIVGPSGVSIQSQVKSQRKNEELDALANDAIEEALKLWSKKQNCDYKGRYSFLDMQNLAITNAGIDGEFVFRKWLNKGAFGFQLEHMDPSSIDTTKNHKTQNGEVRLGIEYDSAGRIVRYHFRKRNHLTPTHASSDELFSLPASSVIHGFINEWPDQSRGVPWMHASLTRNKNLDKYDESAMIASRYGAAKALFLSSKDGEDDPYEGEEDGEGAYEGKTLDSISPGSIEDIGNREIHQFDPKYPHELYDSFTKVNLRAVASGLGVSYHTLSNDLEGVNYSSIRAGVLEDREIFKGLQTWFIDQFIMPVYEEWIYYARMMGAITIGREKTPLSYNRPIEEYQRASFQGRRWAWVDPQKDGQANDLAIRNKTKTRSQIIREQGGDPTETFREFEREEKLMKSFGIAPEQPTKEKVKDDDDENPESDEKDK